MNWIHSISAVYLFVSLSIFLFNKYVSFLSAQVFTVFSNVPLGTKSVGQIAYSIGPLG